MAPGMTSGHTTLHGTTASRGLLLAAVLLALAPAEAAAGPRLGWSNGPRWRLPSQRAPECPPGYRRDTGGALAPVRRARCIESGPKGQVPPSAAQPRGPGLPPPRPSIARPAPTPRPAPVPIHVDPPRPAPTSRVPTIAPGDDASDLMRMNQRTCHLLLNQLEVPFAAVAAREAPEVAIPVRLTGPVAGVTFSIPWSDDLDRDHHAIWDCRLVAAFVPIAEFLHAHGVTEVQYFSALRRGKIVRKKPSSQHNVGLALDLLGWRGPDLPLATVEDTYPRGRLRECPRGVGAPGGPVPVGSPPGDLMLALVCQAHARGLFHTMLTPDHDRDHRNHLHLDLKAGQPSPVNPFLSLAE